MTKRIFLLSISALLGLAASAQEYGSRPTMTEHLLRAGSGEGIVSIHQSSSIDSLMNSTGQRQVELSGSDEYITSRGYRIQIFSGNNQRESKATAYSMESQLREQFPEMETYVSFQSPFWKLRVGNYRTSEEAHAALRELKATFPKWKEMFIVKDAVKYRVGQGN